MDERPGWRRMFDAWNEQVGPRLEQFVRTEAFADQAARFNELNRQRMEMAEAFSRRVLHLWNVPTASDVAALKRQVEALDRQLSKLNKTLQEVRDAGELKRHA
jgi:enamine deaminase RidA (YjgF/YER057c/UK114 family)